jgi:hypothetical protein
LSGNGTRRETGTIVWARKDVAVSSCPKSLISAESEALVEEFLVRRRLGVMDLATLSARQVEAFLVLGNALAAERSNGEHNTRRDPSKFS